MSPIAEGEAILLIDGKGRHFLVKLQKGTQFTYHLGGIDHDDLIGRQDGSTVVTSSGHEMKLIRPRLADYILKIEAGTGSGALTTALVRTVGPTGRVVTVERREDHQKTARKTINRWFGEIPENLDMRIGDVEDVIAEVEPERIVLDLPEPWHAVAVAAEHQPGGAVFCAYIPTVPQIQQLVDAFDDSGRFIEVEVFETLHRTWNISGRSVRPNHQMIGHTGFIITARRCD
jgi:tRNA (adenine57-N1/adenine58-N1)-methyltransferase